MRKFIDIVSEAELYEESPSRIVAHIRSGTPFFMISACRANLTLDINKKRTATLKAKLASLPGVSFVEMTGTYQEKGQEEISVEDSFFVMPRSTKTNTKKFIQVGIILRSVFNQDSILVGDGENVTLMTTNEADVDIGNVATFSAKKLEDIAAHSVIKGRAFGFTTKDHAPHAIEYGMDRDVA